MKRARILIAVAFAIGLAAPHVHAERYDMESAEWHENASLTWRTARTQVEINVTPHPDQPGQTQWFVGGVAFIGPIGSGPYSGQTGIVDGAYTDAGCRCEGEFQWGWGPGRAFALHLVHFANNTGYTIASGVRASTALPPATPPPATSPPTTPPPAGALTVSMTAVANNATVSNTVWPHIWMSGGAAGVNTFTLAVDGKVVASATGSVTHRVLMWNTQGALNGTHRLTATVKDSQGAIGTQTITVIVRN